MIDQRDPCLITPPPPSQEAAELTDDPGAPPRSPIPAYLACHASGADLDAAITFLAGEDFAAMRHVLRQVRAGTHSLALNRERKPPEAPA